LNKAVIFTLLHQKSLKTVADKRLKYCWISRNFKRPYSKSKLELESNSSEILPVNLQFYMWFYTSS